MNVLSESLRRATEAGPPTRIDVDALIAGERRRRQTLIGGSVLGTAAASVAVVLLAQLLTSPGTSGPAPGSAAGGGRSCIALTPSPSQTPASPGDPSFAPKQDNGPYAGPTAGLNPEPMTGTEPVQAAKARLSNAFADALRAVLPGVPFRDWADPNCPLPQFITFDPAFPYEASAVITDAQGRGDIVVHLYPVSAQRPSCDECAWHQDLPGGALAFGNPDVPSRVDIWRPDGTGDMILAVDHQGDPARTTPPATREQMISIGIYPSLSLHP